MITVLIGENVPDLAFGLGLLFTRAGYRTRTTITGDATLASARDDAPDLIVMNPRLPGIDGFDICRRLRAGPATARLPIIMLSVRHQPAEVTAAHAAGADDYIGKPYDNHDLLARAEKLLHRSTPTRETPDFP
ncbi:response regulator transcription factor [Cryptosporangium aurantiacum]|uniref:Two-component system, OmpR family, phosphate regulon response regulator PhoB n=1 Tax=Cryptosporangium aurantiacum TaxID=134849 RepID=A0A1M7L3N5_9ACTN|nr:response regulator [Cryptosporangium aurantiacum]SHM72147.1 two-component system, OmpR family, phosphate regulon response regulator PhoB [Cryptosporangium aurantiacum]